MACPGGSLEFETGEPAVRSLSDVEVREIVERFARLSPYDRDAVPSLLKIERENFAVDEPSRLIPLFGVGISAKRFCLYVRTDAGIVVRKASEHGLGLYRPPTADPKPWDRPWRAWIERVWIRLIGEAEGEVVGRRPVWFSRPAVGQISMTTWNMIRPFERHGRVVDDRIRPYGFMLVGHADPLAPKPPELGGAVTPVAPYSADPTSLLDLAWRNRIDGRTLAVSTDSRSEPNSVRLKTYADVVRDYRWHPERKSGDPAGGVGLRTSRGVLPRRSVIAVGIRHVGKETNRLDEVADGAVVIDEDVHIQYVDERGEWERIRPQLRAIGSKELARRTGMSERTLRSRLNQGRLPRRADRDQLLSIAQTIEVPSSPALEGVESLAKAIRRGR